MSFKLSALDKFRMRMAQIQAERKKDFAVGIGAKPNPKRFTNLDFIRLRREQRLEKERQSGTVSSSSISGTSQERKAIRFNDFRNFVANNTRKAKGK